MASSQKDSSRRNEQYKLFVEEQEKLSPFFLWWYRVRVPEGYKWVLYRDGRLVRIIPAGPHGWWGGFLGKWEKRQIDTRVKLLPFEAEGRVKGPPLPGNAVGANAVDFGCDVTAELNLSVKIVELESFTQYEDPLAIFVATLLNMVVELIGKLPYDQHGEWATVLRDQMRDRLQGRSRGGREDTEQRLGIRVLDVFVTEFKPNTARDRNMLQTYQQVEKARRELIEAQANAQRDEVIAQSFRTQGGILSIAPSLLALQNNPLGKALLERDAELQGLMVYAGINPGVNITMQDPTGQGGYGQPPSIGYLRPPTSSQNPALPPGQAPAGEVTGNLFNTGAIGSTSNNTSQALPPFGPSAPSYPSSPSQPLQPAGESGPPVDDVRQRAEITALEQAGFVVAGKGQVEPLYDKHGQPISGTKEWTLQVITRRSNGNLTIIFHCPMGYPASAPSVQVKSSGGGGLIWVDPAPNAIMTWHVGRKLVDVARELNADIP